MVDSLFDVNSKSSFVLFRCECKIIFYIIILTCRLFYVLILLLFVIVILSLFVKINGEKKPSLFLDNRVVSSYRELRCYYITTRLRIDPHPFHPQPPPSLTPRALIMNSHTIALLSFSFFLSALSAYLFLTPSLSLTLSSLSRTFLYL